MKKLSIYLVLTLLVFSGCKKYEEGPGISLRSKEKRLCQEWKLTKATFNGSYEENEFEYYYWDIQKDGDIVVKLGFEWDGSVDDETFTVEWEWSDDKEEIIITETYDYKNKINSSLFPHHKNTNSSESINCTIMKLKYKELILEYTEDGDLYRLEFEQK